MASINWWMAFTINSVVFGLLALWMSRFAKDPGRNSNPVPALSIASQTASAAPLAAEAASKTVLVVDDDVDIRVELQEVLEQVGYKVWNAWNGEEALKVLEQIGRPSAIVLDLSMPVMNGEDFLRAVREDQDLGSVPVVAISAAREQAPTGVSSFLRKPFELGALLDTLSRAA